MTIALTALFLVSAATHKSAASMEWALRRWLCQTADPRPTEVIDYGDGTYAPPGLRPPLRKFSLTLDAKGRRLLWSVMPFRGEPSYGESKMLELTAWTMRVQHTDQYGSPTDVATARCVRVMVDRSAARDFGLFSLCLLKTAAEFIEERDGPTNSNGSMTDENAPPKSEICTPEARRRR